MPEPLTKQNIEFSYTVYWLKIARAWDADQRRLIADRVLAITLSEDFLNNAFERKYTIEGFDDAAHSGASLLALHKVLEALE